MRLAALALATLLLPKAAAAQGAFGALEQPLAEAGQRHAFLIGIESYSDPAFGPLEFARDDAEGLAHALLEPTWGGFASVELAVDGDLSARGLVQRLQAWSQRLAPEDLAVVYFSGHGTRRIDERNHSQVFLVAADTRKDAPLDTGLPLSAMSEFLAGLPSSRRVLIIDACFTGAGKVDGEAAQEASRELVEGDLSFSERPSEKEAQLFATTYGRPAIEQCSLGHGVYTYYLIAALTDRFDEADVDRDQVVTVSEAHDYARDNTMQATGELQVPMAWYRIVGREELILSGDPASRLRSQLALVTAYDAPQQGLRMFVDGTEKGAFPRTVLVEPGHHRVEFRNLSGKLVDSGQVRFAQAGVYSVGKLRDDLNGGRVMLFAGYAHTWMPDAMGPADLTPSGPGGRVVFTARFPGRNPLVRRLALAVDLGLGVFGPACRRAAAARPTPSSSRGA